MKSDSDQYMTTFEIVMKYLGMLMALIYVTAGITVLYRSHDLFNISQPYIVPLGIGLMSYGLFRGYRLYLKYFKKPS
jgi:hypothetical protein